jgi:hypothetical protein
MEKYEKLDWRRRTQVLIGVVVPSSVGPTKFMEILTVKTAQRFDGDGGFCSMYWMSAIVSSKGRLEICNMFPIYRWWSDFVVLHIQGLVNMIFTHCRICRFYVETSDFVMYIFYRYFVKSQGSSSIFFKK